LLTGGSAFGLDAAGGVMEWLAEKGWGFHSGNRIVPIVSSAVIYDLDVGENSHPNAASGMRACGSAGSGAFAQGAVGAGTGATVCKIAKAMPGGLGSASMDLPGIGKVAALMVVNALGAVYDDERGVCLTPYGAVSGSPAPGGNTTIGVVATDAWLSREQAYKLAQDAHDGLARSVRPAHTPFDGDTIFAMSTAREGSLLDPMKFMQLLHAGAQAVSRAIANALYALSA
jgi:L-aminopeptidase/D-esterase-like protein